ncbi:MAG: PH domain-containing protein, partial [Myxococcales bacterium]
ARMPQPEQPVFRTRYDRWLVVLLAGSFLFSLVVVLTANPRDAWIGLLPLGLTAGFVLWCADTRYAFERDALAIRSGPFHWRVPFAAVRRVVPTRNPLSSPAWSLERLAITYDAGGWERTLMVSPKEQARFLAMLAERCPAASIAAPTV